MKKVIVGSLNPVKIQAVKEGFGSIFPEEGFSFDFLESPSGVPKQPLNDQETHTGAYNRANYAMTLCPMADYWVGIESGVDLLQTNPERHIAFAWVVVLSKVMRGETRTGIFELPHRISDLIIAGYELGEADDIVFGTNNSKQQNGAVGLLTGDALTRSEYYKQAVLLALIPFKNLDLYQIPKAL